MTMRLQSIFAIVCAFVLNLCPLRAEIYPSRSIKLVVSLPAGTTPDIVARLVAEQLTSRLGQSVIVENRPGAAHTIALRYVAAAAPDGYTLFLGTTGAMAINPALYRDLDFSFAKNLAPIILLTGIPNLLAASSEAGLDNFARFTAQTKAHPGTLKFGAGLGTPPHLFGGYIQAKLGLDFLIVPYRGGAQSIPDALGGRIQVVADSPAILLPYIRQGSLKPLLVTSAARLQELPNTPTMAEAGIDGYPPQTWMGLVAPPGLPDFIVQRVNTALTKALNGDLRIKLAKLGFRAGGGSARDFGDLIATDMKKWRAVVEKANLKLTAGN
jgi:tripartite-type tricarboxylate transporter receptor subunit TctC